MRKRFYILFVARDADGQIRKIPIPVHYLYVFMAGALIGMFTITGMAGSYTRMLMKVSRFNELRSEKEQLRTRYTQLEKVSKEKDLQVASLGSLAGEVSAIYGLKTNSKLTPDADNIKPEQYDNSLRELYALRASAMSGVAMSSISRGFHHTTSLAEWVRASAAPTLWPVTGRITSSFGERIDPFNGEGAYHTGIDIATAYGTPVFAPAAGVVTWADFENGYGRTIKIDHGNGISTLYGHLSAYAVAPGQHVRRGEIIGYVGDSGRSTGAHLHYEVRINDIPVNPYKYLRVTLASIGKSDTTSSN